ncbi:ExbD/TolR family protein [Coraliomargarita parva]|uniref:ExbD/TolR family protein n=1 Tax=Coraliomargarita parva TaxID=3014050 RepID=UPI0022B4BAA9|nr:biopolymer transporter ExbD [Coraliomargarita parva]
MKNALLSITAILTLSAFSVSGETEEATDATEILRQEIKDQEIALQEQKKKLAAMEQKNTLEVSITSEGLSTEGEKITLENLEKVLKKLPEDSKVLIRAESTVPMEKVISVMDTCKKAGVKNISMATIKA